MRFLILSIAAAILTNSAFAQESVEQKDNSVDSVHQLVTDVVRDNIPHTYENLKKWNQTSKRWDGLHVKLDGFQVKTKRKWKEVKHGDWSMYRLSLIDPKEAFVVQVNKIGETEDGQLAFDLSFTARVHAFGRIAKWVKGVQLYSFSMDANSHLTLQVQGTVDMALDLVKLPPDVVLEPKVTSAILTLHEFKVYRVSDVGGEVAQQLGRAMKGLIKDKIAEENQKLPEKINKQIAKKQDRLRFSMRDLVASKWSNWSKFVMANATEKKVKPVSEKTSPREF